MEIKNTNHHDLISLTSLWHKWWDIFSTHFLFWVFISFIPWFLSYVTMVVMLGKFITALRTATSWQEILGWQASTLYFIIIGVLIIAILQIFGTLALLVGVVNYRELNTKSILAQTYKLFWKYLGLSLVMGLISLVVIVISYIIVSVLGMLIGLLNLEILVNWFNWLKLIPLTLGLLLSAFLIFSPYSLIEKNNSIIKSIKHSFLLIRGHFWPVIIRLIIAYVVILTLVIIFNLIPLAGPVFAITLSSPALVIYVYLIYNDLASIKKN